MASNRQTLHLLGMHGEYTIGAIKWERERDLIHQVFRAIFENWLSPGRPQKE